MAIFNSYVKLPEGTPRLENEFVQTWDKLAKALAF